MSDSGAIPPSVLVFHKLLAQVSFGVTNYSPRRLEHLLKTLSDAGWSLVSHEPGKRLLITFDDGYQHLEDVLPPLMSRLSFLPIIFVPTALIGKPNRWDYSYRLRLTPHLDRDAIRRLADLGVIFGSHGSTHSDLTRCRKSDLETELVDSRKILQDLTGQQVQTLSYPFGRCNNPVKAAAQEAGYQVAYTMRFPQESDPPLARGRFPVYGFDTRWSVCQKLDRGPAYQIERFKTATVGRLSGGTVLLNRLRRSGRD